MKEDLVKFLEKDCETLQRKMMKALESEDIGTYKNLMRALAEANDLIRKNEWKLKYSEYETDGHKEVAVWEQNYDGEIRNHKTWETVYSGNPTQSQLDTDGVKVGDFILVESDMNHKNIYIDYETGKDAQSIYIFNCFDDKYDYSFRTEDKNRIIKACVRFKEFGYKVSVCENGMGLIISDMLAKENIKHNKLKRTSLINID